MTHNYQSYINIQHSMVLIHRPIISQLIWLRIPWTSVEKQFLFHELDEVFQGLDVSISLKQLFMNSKNSWCKERLATSLDCLSSVECYKMIFKNERWLWWLYLLLNPTWVVRVTSLLCWRRHLTRSRVRAWLEAKAARWDDRLDRKQVAPIHSVKWTLSR